MSNEHTPAPWDSIKDKHGMDGGHQLIAIMGGDESDRRVLITSINDGCQVANENLIKNAPLLLEALKYIVALEFNGDDQELKKTNALLTKISGVAKDAIKKAKGN